jgi:hypothetical protein
MTYNDFQDDWKQHCTLCGKVMPGEDLPPSICEECEESRYGMTDYYSKSRNTKKAPKFKHSLKEL